MLPEAVVKKEDHLGETAVRPRDQEDTGMMDREGGVACHLWDRAVDRVAWDHYLRSGVDQGVWARQM